MNGCPGGHATLAVRVKLGGPLDIDASHVVGLSNDGF